MSISEAFERKRIQAGQRARQEQEAETKRRTGVLNTEKTNAQTERDHSMASAETIRNQMLVDRRRQQDALARIPTEKMWQQVAQLWKQEPIEASTVYQGAKLGRFSEQSFSLPPTIVSYPVVVALLKKSRFSGGSSLYSFPNSHLLPGSDWLQFFQTNFRDNNWKGVPRKRRDNDWLTMPRPELFSHRLVTGIYQACSFGGSGVIYDSFGNSRTGYNKCAYGVNRFVGLACTGPEAILDLWIGLESQDYSQTPGCIIGEDAKKTISKLKTRLFSFKPSITIPLTGIPQPQIAEQIASVLFDQKDLVLSQRKRVWDNDRE